jgi:hypothetical protein
MLDANVEVQRANFLAISCLGVTRQFEQFSRFDVPNMLASNANRCGFAINFQFIDAGRFTLRTLSALSFILRFQTMSSDSNQQDGHTFQKVTYIFEGGSRVNGM